eukprot:275488_1
MFSTSTVSTSSTYNMGVFFTREETEVVNKWAIRKEGFLYKQSRHLNSWRKRWIVLHQNYLYTFTAQQIYTNPTEKIDLTQFKTITPPQYDDSLKSYILTLHSDDMSRFKFHDIDADIIKDWYHAICNAIRATNDNLLCTMLPPDIIIGPIASYFTGYKRFQTLCLINKHFATLFCLDTFDFSGVYWSDATYFLLHFDRFCNANYFAVKQGLYRSFYNPDGKYNDIYINKHERKQLLYLLISYGPLMDAAKRYTVLNGHTQRSQSVVKCMNYFNETRVKSIGIPRNIIKYDFSRHLNSNSKLVALTFSEIRNEDDDESESLDGSYVQRHNAYDGMEDEAQFHYNQQTYVLSDLTSDSKSSKVKIHCDVKWICQLFLWGHRLTFEQIEIVDLSHNAWDENDIYLISDSILRRDSQWRVKQMFFDGIPMLNELEKSHRSITKLFEAIEANCDRLNYLSLNHCLLRDGSCDIIKKYYQNNTKTKLMTVALINNNITERGVDVLNEINEIVVDDTDLAFVVGFFYANTTNRWNHTIKVDDDYVYTWKS